MNLKTIQKNYHLLSPLERFCLHQSAVFRDDEIERKAVRAASGKVTFEGTDFSALASRVFIVNYRNLLARIGYAQQCLEMLFTAGGLIHDGDARASASYEKSGLYAYLYLAETDGLAKAGERMGINIAEFRDEQAKNYLAARWLSERDEIFRAWGTDWKSKNEVIDGDLPTVESEMKKYLGLLQDESLGLF